MNRFFPLPLMIALAIFCSCQKQQTEEETNADIERKVQQRLAAEHQLQQEQELARREAELGAREKAVAEKERVPDKPRAPETPRSFPTSRAEPYANRAAASFSTFYTKLEPYGAWRETADYGYVWQPLEAERSRSWRPYTNGRWVYTDLGWTWISEEPFGWATCHYGRWTRLRHIGWVWVPSEEWAPAWVSWRKGADYIGWAPLPPEARFDRRAGIHNWADNYYDIGPDQYCFVSTKQFGAQRVAPTIIAPERNVAIVNQTTNVTNITYNNATVVNQGPDYYELRAHTQQPIEHLRVERRTTVNLDRENPSAVVKGEVVEMAAPAIARGRSVERPQHVRQSVTQTTVDRGWEAIADSQVAEKARVKIRSESTPPPDAPPRTFVKPAQASAETSAAAAPAAETSVATTPAPDATASDQPATRFGRRNTPSATPIPDISSSPTPIATATATATAPATVTATATATATAAVTMPTPTPTPGEVIAPDSTAIPAVSPRRSEPPGFPQKREKKNLDRKPVVQQVEPGTGAEALSSPSAPSPVQPRDNKEKKKEEKKEKRREKKERGEPGEIASPTPTPSEQ